jgi:predicted acylesterase/phospholipase RssA
MLKYNPPTVLIEPNLLDFASLDFTQAQRALDEGTAACTRVRRALLNKVKKRI